MTSTPPLADWLAGKLPGECLTPEAGARRYFRSTHPSAAGWLRVTSPVPAPQATTDFLTRCGVRVPRLGPQADGVYLVEDLGDRHLADAPTVDSYRELLSAWHRFTFQDLTPGHPNRQLTLDSRLFRTELSLFREAYLEGACSLKVNGSLRAELRHAAEKIADLASAGPWSLQHRDFHSRNVLLPKEGPLAILDHQDLRPGPFLYDLCSLSSDAYLDLPHEVQDFLSDNVIRLGNQLGLSPEQTILQFTWTGLQRVLKALGTFGRLLLIGRTDYMSAAHRAHRHAGELLASTPGMRVLKEVWADIEPPCPKTWAPLATDDYWIPTPKVHE